MPLALPSERELSGCPDSFAELLAAVDRERGRARGPVVAPLVFENATGAPVDPLAGP